MFNLPMLVDGEPWVESWAGPSAEQSKDWAPDLLDRRDEEQPEMS